MLKLTPELEKAFSQTPDFLKALADEAISQYKISGEEVLKGNTTEAISAAAIATYLTELHEQLNTRNS